MKVLMAASEAVPFAKTGGLADVIGSLSSVLRKQGVEVVTSIPCYQSIKADFKLIDTGIRGSVPVGGSTHSYGVLSDGKGTYFIDCPEFFGRDGLYGTSAGEYADNAARFVLYSRATLDMCISLGFSPDVIHCNDWQSGLMPLYAKTLYRHGFERALTLMTIHNMGYQGIFPASAMTLTGLPAEFFNPGMIEFYGQVNFLKAGMVAASAISTVSPNYAREITGPEHGFGLEGVAAYRSSALHGILNGIDYSEWDPSADSLIWESYSRGNMNGKARCKHMLREQVGIKQTDRPLMCIVSRLVSQKGVDILLEAVDEIVSQGVDLVVLGTGDVKLQDALLGAETRHNEFVRVVIGYDDALAHRMFAGSDMAIIPSKYEPCGLTPMIAMRYGTVPVVRATGGLADIVTDFNINTGEGNGFVFRDYTSGSLLDAVKRAACLHATAKRWNALVANCMEMDYSWERSAGRYMELYTDLVRPSAARG